MLVVLGDGDGYADRSFGNLPEVQTIVAGELNAYDILVNDWVVFTDETLPGGGHGRRSRAPSRRPTAPMHRADTRRRPTKPPAPTPTRRTGEADADTDDEEGSGS